jgi:hypothetical protein
MRVQVEQNEEAFLTYEKGGEKRHGVQRPPEVQHIFKIMATAALFLGLGVV